MQNTAVLKAVFKDVPIGTSGEPPAIFEEYHRDSTYFPRVFDLEGEQVQLEGPLEVISKFKHNGFYEEVRSNKRRLVRVEFYKYTSEGKVRSGSAYAWQGDNNLLHLMEDHTVLLDDPLDAAQSSQDSQEFSDSLDELHADLLTAAYDETEAFEATA